MTAMLGILFGQIVAGWVFDRRYTALGGTEAAAWAAALLPVVVLTLLAVPALALAWLVPRIPPAGGQPLRAAVLVEHFLQLKDLWRDRALRRASLGAAFFWGFAGFINLWSVKVAKVMTGGQGGFGTMSSGFMAAASLGMVAGFGLAAGLLRRRIELGWVPVAGVGMCLTSVALACLPPDSWLFLGMLAFLALSSAVFLSPLNAWLQDHYPADRRGELQAAVNLQDCLAGMVAVGIVVGLGFLTDWLRLDPLLGIRIQLLVVALLCGLITLYIIRLMPASLIRVLATSLVRSLYQFRSVHPARLPATGGVLLLANHVTWADSFLISAACGRPVRFVMDEAFMRRPAIRWFVTLFETVAIRRDQPREAIRMVTAALQAGDVVCLFPEGQLTRTGTLSKLQRGFELMAGKGGHPLLPLWCDGSWGSVFSFERGRFFGKWPLRCHRRQIVAAFGEPLAPAAANVAGLRHALLKAGAEAIAHRFQAPVWQQKTPRGGEDLWRSLSPDERRRLWVNGYQIGQIHGLQRRHGFSVLAAELTAAGTLPAAALLAFSALFKSPLWARPEASLADGGTWAGGDRLRALLETATLTEPVTFYDFSARALEPLQVPHLRHFPGLACSGMVVAMAMPDPAQVPDLKDVQSGSKPGTWGKLLPGWFTLPDAGGGLRLHGPAAPAAGLPLPDTCRVDDEGFAGPA
jgi:acyl-[acyl-carrier-protein]-phospholipid O-acyltransferase/long-chain-fatty-acid--[acyl-carrier-protein] ligase